MDRKVWTEELIEVGGRFPLQGRLWREWVRQPWQLPHHLSGKTLPRAGDTAYGSGRT